MLNDIQFFVFFKLNLLQYFQVVRRKHIMERVVGIEPTLSGRKHDILPLNYTRIYLHYRLKVIYFQEIWYKIK